MREPDRACPSGDAALEDELSLQVETYWLVVFDLDGTLIDSSLDLCLAINATLSHVGLPKLPNAVITGFIGDGAAALVQRAMSAAQNRSAEPAPNSTDDPVNLEIAFRFFLAFYREHKLDNTYVYDGVLSSLVQIRAAAPQLLMAVLTNKPVGPSRDICNALGLSPFFFANYGGNSFKTKKPSPEGLLTIIAEAKDKRLADRGDGLNLQPRGVLMVGDSETDVLTARLAGVRSLGCLYGLSPESLRAAEPDLLCERPADWPKLLHFDEATHG